MYIKYLQLTYLKIRNWTLRAEIRQEYPLFLQIRNKAMVPTLTTIIQYSFGSLSHSNQRRKRNKSNPDWKRRSKTLAVCRWDDPLHKKNPKDSTRKLLELINEYSKFAEYEINTQKSLAFLHTNNEKVEIEIKKQFHSPLQRKK